MIIFFLNDHCLVCYIANLLDVFFFNFIERNYILLNLGVQCKIRRIDNAQNNKIGQKEQYEENNARYIFSKCCNTLEGSFCQTNYVRDIWCQFDENRYCHDLFDPLRNMFH